MYWLLAMVVVIFVLFVALGANRKRNLLRIKAKLEQDNLIRQEQVMKLLTELGDLIYNASLTVDEIRMKADVIFSALEAQNTDGLFTGMIQDTSQYLAEELEKKSVGKIS